MEPQNNERLPLELSSQLVSIMTTEHYTLQTGRSMTIAEANGRSSLFVGAVSSGLVALAFVGQLSHSHELRNEVVEELIPNRVGENCAELDAPSREMAETEG